jgi:hypothetical protein
VTTFYSILIALAVFVPGFPLSMWLAEKAGVPDYGCNPDQKPGWTILYILVLFPTTLAFAWIAAIIVVWLLYGHR